MDTLFLVLMFFTALSAIGTVIAFIQYMLERTSLGWVLGLASLTISVTSFAMVVFAMIKVFGWWSLALVFVTLAQALITQWVITHPQILDRPFYRVGGRPC